MAVLVARATWLGCGAVIGLVVALPLRDVDSRCPASGEGLGLCVVQKSWAPAALLLLGCIVLAGALWRLVFEKVPVLWEHWRAGERPVRLTRRQAKPPYRHDPFLLAASAGIRTGESEPDEVRATNRVRPEVEELRKRFHEDSGEAA